MMIGVAVIVGNQLFYIQVHLTGKLILWPYVEEKMLCDHSQEIKGCKYGGGVSCVNFCWVCANSLSEPLPHFYLFYGQLLTLIMSVNLYTLVCTTLANAVRNQ